MEMTYNDAIARHNLTVNLLLKSGDSEIPKSAKVKVIKNRIELGKVRKDWDECLEKYAEQLTTDEYRTLANTENRTDEQNAKLQEIEIKINEEFNACVESKVNEKVQVNFETFTEDEFADIINVNADNEVNINGQTFNGPQFLEMCYTLLVG